MPKDCLSHKISITNLIRTLGQLRYNVSNPVVHAQTFLLCCSIILWFKEMVEIVPPIFYSEKNIRNPGDIYDKNQQKKRLKLNKQMKCMHTLYTLRKHKPYCSACS